MSTLFWGLATHFKKNQKNIALFFLMLLFRDRSGN